MVLNNSENTPSNLAALTSNMELLLSFIINDSIVFNAFLIISQFERWISELNKFKTIDILKVVGYADTYNDFTEDFRFFCFTANCIKNHKKILCTFTTSIYGTFFR
jgi:hypothetical protein